MQFIELTIKNAKDEVMFYKKHGFGSNPTSATTGGNSFKFTRDKWKPENTEDPESSGEYTYTVRATDTAELCHELIGTFKLIEPSANVSFTSPPEENSEKIYYGLNVPISGLSVNANGVKKVNVSLVNSESENSTVLETQETSTYWSSGAPIEHDFYKSFNPAILGVKSGTYLHASVTITDVNGDTSQPVSSPSFKWCRNDPCPSPIPIFSESYDNTFQIGENNEQKI
ncbi:hypothetical protein [Thioflexithrix psekupsensis]|uniref:Uncharacterized protein n=1 Tax=Thioflexithrix psekupsensis TaxID=1570016 RepID=A0A251XD14_9GAMM|nr:hypothetical protein [Thioflexithrix psekupsensis]OUD16265.1 hypothetical protein TPSD3_00655 [Thioflexithrix psekupsensis]